MSYDTTHTTFNPNYSYKHIQPHNQRMKERKADLVESRIQKKEVSAGRLEDNFYHTWVPADDMGLHLSLELEGELQHPYQRVTKAGMGSSI